MNQLFFLPKELILNVYDSFCLLWCQHEHFIGNQARFAKRLLFVQKLDYRSYACECCLQIQYHIIPLWNRDWNTIDFPTLPEIVFEQYNDWLNRIIDKNWDTVSERLYYTDRYIPIKDAMIICNPKPKRESEFELPLCPYYQDEKQHRLVRCIKRKELKMINESNKRRRI